MRAIPVRPTMPLFSRHGDPLLDQIARDTFALFPNCHRCGIRIDRLEDADVRVLVLRVVHRGRCPVATAHDASDLETTTD